MGKYINYIHWAMGLVIFYENILHDILQTNLYVSMEELLKESMEEFFRMVF